jgi:hypothetical protein
MGITKTINKLITHPRDRAGDFGIRLVTHIPHGIIMSIPILGWSLIPLFKAYQRNEDLHTEDQAWKDYAGAITGAFIGIAAQVVALIIFAVRR